MATLNYIIKSELKSTFATLWIRLRSGREYDIFTQSGYSVYPELWNEDTFAAAQASIIYKYFAEKNEKETAHVQKSVDEDWRL